MLNNFEEVILNGHDRKREFQDSKNFIYSPEDIPKHILDVPYDLETLGPKRFVVNTKKKIRVKDREYSLTEIWPTGAARKIIEIVPLTNGEIPSSTLGFQLGKPIRFLNSNPYQFNFVYGNGNHTYSINSFPKGMIEKLREVLKNIKDLEGLL